MNRSTLWAAVTAAALAGPPNAKLAYAEDLVSAEDPNAILEIARGFGSAELAKDEDGDPMITGRTRGTRYAIYFYQCTDGQACENIQFSAAWSGYRVSADQLHAWNRDMLFGKAYLDEVGDPVLEMAVNLKYGVTRKNLDDTFDWWKVVLQEFEDIVLNAVEAQGGDMEHVSDPI